MTAFVTSAAPHPSSAVATSASPRPPRRRPWSTPCAVCASASWAVSIASAATQPVEARALRVVAEVCEDVREGAARVGEGVARELRDVSREGGVAGDGHASRDLGAEVSAVRSVTGEARHDAHEGLAVARAKGAVDALDDSLKEQVAVVGFEPVDVAGEGVDVARGDELRDGDARGLLEVERELLRLGHRAELREERVEASGVGARDREVGPRLRGVRALASRAGLGGVERGVAGVGVAEGVVRARRSAPGEGALFAVDVAEERRGSYERRARGRRVAAQGGGPRRRSRGPARGTTRSLRGGGGTPALARHPPRVRWGRRRG